MHSIASPQAMLMLIFVWRFVPDSIFLAFDFCWTKKTATTTKWKTWIKSDGLLIRFTVLNRTGHKLLARSHFISESLALLWAPLQEHCRIFIPVCPICNRTMQCILHTFRFFFKYTFIWNKKCRKHIFIVEWNKVSKKYWISVSISLNFIPFRFVCEWDFGSKANKLKKKLFIFIKKPTKYEIEFSPFHDIRYIYTHGYKGKRRNRYVICWNECCFKSTRREEQNDSKKQKNNKENLWL